MEGISIKQNELRSSANEMRSRISSMKEDLQTATKVMDSTKDSFQASSGDSLREKYDRLKLRFDNFYNEMMSYADFLDKTATIYDNADTKISKAADDILES